MRTTVDNLRGCLDADAVTLAAVASAEHSAIRLVAYAVGTRWGLGQVCAEAAVAATEYLVRAAVATAGDQDETRDPGGRLLDRYRAAQTMIDVRVIWHVEHVLIEVAAPVVQPPGEGLLNALPDPCGSYCHYDDTGRVCAQTVWCGVETDRMGVRVTEHGAGEQKPR